MCGLVGLISNRELGFFDKDTAMMYDMMVINSLRGAHSTGIFGVHLKKKETDWAKVVGSPYMAMNEKPYKDIFENISKKYRAVVGHGRFATSGLVNAPNAHPFEVGDVTLVHNGTLRNIYSFDVIKELDVDSQLLAYLIAKEGAKEAYKKLSGAIACIWYDKEKDRVFAIRNSERPLWLAESDDNTILCSEEATIHWLRYKYPEQKIGDPKYLIEHSLYSFPICSNETWEREDLTPHKIVPYMPTIIKSREPVIDKKFKRRELKSFTIGGSKIILDSIVTLFIDDTRVIYSLDNTPKRIVAHCTHPKDSKGEIANFTFSVDPVVVKDEDMIGCRAVKFKVKQIIKREEMAMLQVHGTLENLVFDTDIVNKESLIIEGEKMCADCNIPLEGGNIVTSIVSGEKREVCFSCAGIPLQ